jgi:hypothetical protein
MANFIEGKVQAAQSTREVSWFTIPKSIPCPYDEVGMVELKSGEEMQASKRSEMSPMRLPAELTKQSLVAGKLRDSEVTVKLSAADGSVDEAWDKLGPMVRSMCIQAYNEMHSPPEGATEGFLKSRKVVV